MSTLAAKPESGPRVSTVMVALAWRILQDPDDRPVARSLARCVIDASGDDSQRVIDLIEAPSSCP